MFRFYATVIALVSFGTAGCAYTDFKQATYEGLHTRQCIKDTHNPACDPDHLSYQEYKRERDKIVK
jgi:hypothetical protein